MRVSCPACGAELSLEVLLAHEGARRALLAAMQVGPALADRLVRYLALFRPAKRQLTMDRVAALLDELVPMIRSATVHRAGRAWSAPIDTWRAAIDTVLAHRDGGKLVLPLKGHGYLLAVIVGMVDRAEGQAEAAQEARLLAGQRDHAARAEADEQLRRTAAAVPENAPPLMRPGCRIEDLPPHLQEWLAQFKKKK